MGSAPKGKRYYSKLLRDRGKYLVKGRGFSLCATAFAQTLLLITVLQEVFFAFIWVALLILGGRIIKQRVRWIQRLYLPESIVAGALALILGPQVLGAIATALGGEGTLLSGGLFTEAIREVWSQSPGIFINIVFAALFLGEVIPNPGTIWRKAAPQVVFGQSLAWGQYVVCLMPTQLQVR